MHPHAIVRAPDGTTYEVAPGDVLGRLHTAAVPIDDGRVSEAHAMVSLRDGSLRLLALRGAFAVDGRPLDQVELAPGLAVSLARGVAVHVLEVALPEQILGIEAPGVPLRALPGVASLSTQPRPRVSRGWHEGAAAHVWSTGGAWRLAVDRAQTREIQPGDHVRIGEVTFRFAAIPLAGLGHSATRRTDGLTAPLTVVAHFDSVHIHRGGHVALHLGGVLARMVSELVSFDGPVGWQVLAAELWPEGADPQVLRGRLDANLSRLRRKLRASGLRTDLVRTDGAGQVELILYARDTAQDRT